MPHSLSDTTGFPFATETVDLAAAAERRYEVLLGQAAGGDERAHDELIALRITYIAWAYGKQGGPLPAGTDRPRRGSDRAEGGA